MLPWPPSGRAGAPRGRDVAVATSRATTVTPPGKDTLRVLAAWALLHEVADEGWKAAVARGRSGEDVAPGLRHGGHDEGRSDARDAPRDERRAEARGDDAFVDALAALVANEKERLRSDLFDSARHQETPPDLGASLDALRFELAEMRGRIESLQASVDALRPLHED